MLEPELLEEKGEKNTSDCTAGQRVRLDQRQG